MHFVKHGECVNKCEVQSLDLVVEFSRILTAKRCGSVAALKRRLQAARSVYSFTAEQRYTVLIVLSRWCRLAASQRDYVERLPIIVRGHCAARRRQDTMGAACCHEMYIVTFL